MPHTLYIASRCPPEPTFTLNLHCRAPSQYVYWADLRRGPASERAQNASNHSSVRTVDLKGIYLGFSCPQSEAFSRMDKNGKVQGLFVVPDV